MDISQNIFKLKNAHLREFENIVPKIMSSAFSLLMSTYICCILELLGALLCYCPKKAFELQSISRLDYLIKPQRGIWQLKYILKLSRDPELVKMLLFHPGSFLNPLFCVTICLELDF